MNFFELLGCFTVFYILRYFLDSKYKKTAKNKVVIDIVITTFLAFIISTGIHYLFN
ncbi:hypothetical protein ABID96_002652 [Bacillus sp. OAE603]